MKFKISIKPLIIVIGSLLLIVASVVLYFYYSGEKLTELEKKVTEQSADSYFDFEEFAHNGIDEFEISVFKPYINSIIESETSAYLVVNYLDSKSKIQKINIFLYDINLNKQIVEVGDFNTFDLNEIYFSKNSTEDSTKISRKELVSLLGQNERIKITYYSTIANDEMITDEYCRESRLLCAYYAATKAISPDITSFSPNEPLSEDSFLFPVEIRILND